jgi:ABC-type multidrug transport system ATPase subunit
MTELLDCMMPSSAPWKSQAVRFISAHLALDIIYLPGWVVIAVILQRGVYSKTSLGILLIYHILAGLGLSSFSLFGAAFFKRAQLSGITGVIVCLLLGIIAQVIGPESNAGVAILSLLFPPMNYVYFSIFMARWEQQKLGADLVSAAPETLWTLPGIIFWVFAIVQIIVYPILAGVIERQLYGTRSSSRQITTSPATSPAVSLTGFAKEYKPNWFYKNVGKYFGSHRQPVLAVDNLTLSVGRGEIFVLLGANGSGKSTTLDAISGLSKVSSGDVAINYAEGESGFGLCPQKNVLWDRLTVFEHVKIFNRLKSEGAVSAKSTLHELLEACDLDKKVKAQSRTLSGGQKRKLQLAMMFTGGSTLCCVDEVSSGLDPISRRRIWEILLAERGRRTILLTTHFLDEAELLADYIAILSKGVLKAQGSSVELKNKLGSGYRIHVYFVPGSGKSSIPQFDAVPYEENHDQIIYSVPDSSQAAQFVARLEELGITEYRVSGPTIEDVFLKVAEEMGRLYVNGDSDDPKDEAKMDYRTPNLLMGKRIGMPEQAWVLFCKRATILRRNYLPYLAAFLLPVLAAGLVTLFLDGFQQASCTGPESRHQFDIESILSQISIELVLGPTNRLLNLNSGMLAGLIPGGLGAGGNSGINITSLLNRTHFVDSLQEFNDYIDTNFRNVTPGGFYLGDDDSPPTFAWRGTDISFPAIVQNAMNNLLTGVPISTQYQRFDLPWAPDSGDALQLITYFGLALSAYPAFFSLYPTVERLRHIRALHYSNGVRSAPLWLAYVAFDFLIVLVTSVIAIAVFTGVTKEWYHPGYLFVILFLYGLASTLLAYVLSIFAKSQLAAFAFTAGYQA